MTEPVPPYRLKIARARRHINELAGEVQAFMAREPYEMYQDDDRSAGLTYARVRIKENIPAEWSTIIGDIIHNARASLDLLMVEVVRHCDPNRASYNHVHFVIRESKEEFEKALPKNLKGASSDAIQIIKNLKPYKGGDESFWQLHQLDILDKHKAIIPVGSAYRSLRLNMAEGLRSSTGQPFDPYMVALRPADRMFPLQDGAALYACPIDNHALKNIEANIEIAFGKGQILDGASLDPALSNTCLLAERVFNVFEAGLLGFKK